MQQCPASTWPAASPPARVGLAVAATAESEKTGSAPKRGRHSTIIVPPSASVQWQQPGVSTIHTKKWFLGAGFLGAPPISLPETSSVGQWPVASGQWPVQRVRRAQVAAKGVLDSCRASDQSHVGELNPSCDVIVVNHFSHQVVVFE